MTTYYTDYPFTQLGDEPFRTAPIRPIQIIRYDGDKYVVGIVENELVSLKRGYVYKKPGRCGTVPEISQRALDKLIGHD